MKHEHIYIYMYLDTYTNENNANVPAKRNITNLPLVWFGQCAFPSQSENLVASFQPWYQYEKYTGNAVISWSPIRSKMVVSTHLKNMLLNIGWVHLPQISVKIKNYLKPPPRIWCTKKATWYSSSSTYLQSPVSHEGWVDSTNSPESSLHHLLLLQLSVWVLPKPLVK